MATSNKQIVGKYELGKVLAAGYFDCRTRLCTHIVTGAQYVVRIYNKSVLAEAQWMWDRIRDAIHVMRTLPKHENIIETSECFETQSSLYILMQHFAPMHLTKLYTSETASGQRVLIPLHKTKHYYTQVVRGLLHMHNRSVVHLGIAPDHIMLNDRDQVKIGYLVSCTYFPKGKLCKDIRGTTHTVAPEILSNQEYDPYVADAWSMGVLLYFMLHQGRYPHDGANTTKNIINHRIRPPDPNLSAEAKDILLWLLHPVPARRLRVEEILSHPFFATNHNSNNNNINNNSENIDGRRYSKRNTETDYIIDPITGESIINIKIPLGLSREEEAAYIIQQTYRAYKLRKHHEILTEVPQRFIRGKEGEEFLHRRFSTQPSSSTIKLPRKHITSFMEMENNTTGMREQRQNQNHHQQQQQRRLSRGGAHTPPPLNMSDFEYINKEDHPEYEGIKKNNNNNNNNGSVVLFNCSSVEEDESPIMSHSKDYPIRQSSSHFNSHTHSRVTNDGGGVSVVDNSNNNNNNNNISEEVIRKGGEEGVGNGSITGTGTNSGSSGVGDRISEDNMLTTNLVHSKHKLHSSERDNAIISAFLSNLRVDATRPCPACNRLPMQRLNGRAPYNKTSYVYKQGEFTTKMEESW